MHKGSENAKQPQVVAHRGASAYAPETTIASYEIALQMGVDFLELDVRMLRDGALVAIHDSHVDRTTNGKGSVADLTLAEIRQLDAGSWFNRACPDRARPEFIGQRVPTVQEVLDLVAGTNVGLYLEMKNPELRPDDFEVSLLSLIRKNLFERRSLFLSFDPRSLERIKAADASIRTALLIEDMRSDPVTATLAFQADEIAIQHGLATQALVDYAHANGLSVSAWTVNKKTDLTRMIEIGADRIVTDYPERLNRLLGKIST